MAARYGEENQLVRDIKELEDHVTKGFTRKALDLICEKGGAGDLGLVRKMLKDDFVGYSKLDIEYLRKHGEWQDIPLIIASLGRVEYGASLLSYAYEAKYRTAARAIYAIGKRRLTELLNLVMPSPLLARLIVESSDKAYRDLSDGEVRRLLQFNDEAVRKATALKAVRTFSKHRLRQVLNDYILREEQRYYNVIHWLDLGVSAPKNLAQRAAAKTISQVWPD